MESYFIICCKFIYYGGRIHGCDQDNKKSLVVEGFFDEFSLHQGITTIYCDSQNAIHLTKNQICHERMKNTDVKFYFIRDAIDEGKVLVKKINTEKNPIDMFTKPLPVYKFK